MNDKAAGLPHFKVVQRMLEVVILRFQDVLEPRRIWFGSGNLARAKSTPITYMLV